MQEKRRIRALVRAARAERIADPAATAALTQRLATLTAETGATRVACFVSVKGEPDTAPFLSWALDHGVEVLLPRSLEGASLEWALYSAGALRPGAFGIPEPSGPALADGAAATADLLLIPAAAIDLAGTRLGWGKGYYDRELAQLQAREIRPPVYAVVWESEIYAELPAEAHDLPVDGAATEQTLHHFG